jgi:hypothetical protein
MVAASQPSRFGETCCGASAIRPHTSLWSFAGQFRYFLMRPPLISSQLVLLGLSYLLPLVFLALYSEKSGVCVVVTIPITMSSIIESNKFLMAGFLTRCFTSGARNGVILDSVPDWTSKHIRCNRKQESLLSLLTLFYDGGTHKPSIWPCRQTRCEGCTRAGMLCLRPRCPLHTNSLF